jgi:hypothetical protein
LLQLDEWAIQDSNLTSENPASDIENAENKQSSLGGVSKSASLVDKSEQILQLLALLQGLSCRRLLQLLACAQFENFFTKQVHSSSIFPNLLQKRRVQL